MSHMDFATLESAMSEETPCDLWLSRLENAVGHDLDGDQRQDGFSLDQCIDWYKAGLPVKEAAAKLRMER